MKLQRDVYLVMFTTETALLKLTLTSKYKGEMTEWASCVVLRGGEMSGSTVLREFSSGTWRSETLNQREIVLSYFFR